MSASLFTSPLTTPLVISPLTPTAPVLLDSSSNTTSSIEQVRAALDNGTPTVVHDALVPFLRLESKSPGDTRVINEICQNLSRLLYPWFQNLDRMRMEDQQSLYKLLKPDGLFIDTLLQYHMLNRKQPANDNSNYLAIGMDSFPIEYQQQPSKSLEYLVQERLPQGIRKKNEQGQLKLYVDALEYFLYHLCKSLVPPRENTVSQPSSYTAPSTPRSPAPGSSSYHQSHPQSSAIRSGSMASSISREYICFFLPVAIPEVSSSTTTDSSSDASISNNGTTTPFSPPGRSPINQLRNRLHDLTPTKSTVSTQHVPTKKPGTVESDLLDVCNYNMALEVANFFGFCAAFLWLPAIPSDIRNASLLPEKQQKQQWLWIPCFSHLAALSLFHLVVGYLAKGERQMERHHISAANSAEAYEKRIGMNSTIRETLRVRCFTTPLADTLGLMLASCGERASSLTDTDVWIPFLDAAASVWIRYVLPWRGGSNKVMVDQPNGDSSLPAVWQARIPLMVQGIGSALYGPTFSLFIKQMSSPHIDLLLRSTTSLNNQRHNNSNVHSWIHDVVGSVFGHYHTVDALEIVERVISAFNSSELRAILAAIEQCQYGNMSMSMRMSMDTMMTPTKQIKSQRHVSASGSILFENQMEEAQRHLMPCLHDLARGVSRILDPLLVQSDGSSVVFNCLPNGPVLQSLVQSLYAAERLADRQLRLIVPERSAEQARSLVSDIFLVLSRILSATSNDTSDGGGASETMRARAQTLQEAQSRISSLYGKVAQVFGVSRQEIDDERLMEARNSLGSPFSLANVPVGRRLSANLLSSSMFEVSGSECPDMELNGLLSPRGRWELKTGRKKFTPQSFSQGSILPRGPRALYLARSYESQWLLDHLLSFNVVANRRYQQFLDFMETESYPIPHAVRTYELSFRWLAAYQNLRFIILLFVVWAVFYKLFF